MRIPLEEGNFWLRSQPGLALIAWQEALRRCDDSDAPGIFGLMRSAAPDDAAFRERLLEITDGRAALQMDWFLTLRPEAARPRIVEFAPIAAQCDARRRAAFSRRAAELDAQR